MMVRVALVRAFELPPEPGARKRRSMRKTFVMLLACGHGTSRRRHAPPIEGEEYRCERCELAAVAS